MSILNPSKGVDYYVFLAKENYCVKYKAPSDLGFSHSDKIFHYQDDVLMQTSHIEISKIDISLWNKSGRLEWKVYDKDNDNEDNKIAGKYIDINPGTGNVGSTNIEPTLQENSIVNKDNNYAISYGFYDASSGDFSALTNYDQSYVYVTPCMSNWMGDLVASNAKYGLCKFNNFALAGSHDAGMYNNSEAMKLMKNKEYTSFLSKLSEDFLNNHGVKLDDDAKQNIKDYIKLFQKLVATGGENIIVNLAMTQKDDISMQLDLGTRFFDIRPGFCSYADSFVLPTKVSQATGINNLYHQHALVPGMSFDQILNEALNWLDKNKKEIIVMNLNFQGFILETMKPTPQFLDDYINNVISELKITISIGSKADLNTSYNDLIKDHKRLIFLNQIGETTDAQKYDSYNNTYKTTNADVIIDALNGMNKNGQKESDYTVLQLQGTANGIISDIVDSSATFSKLTSPLMSTKANFDTKTYPWIHENVHKNFEKDQLIVFLNDFSENALAQQSCWITQKRMDN